MTTSYVSSRKQPKLRDAKACRKGAARAGGRPNETAPGSARRRFHWSGATTGATGESTIRRASAGGCTEGREIGQGSTTKARQPGDGRPHPLQRGVPRDCPNLLHRPPGRILPRAKSPSARDSVRRANEGKDRNDSRRLSCPCVPKLLASSAWALQETQGLRADRAEQPGRT